MFEIETQEERRRRLTIPLLVDVEIRGREDYEQAKWLYGLPRFYCKQLKATVRLIFLGPYGASLEILRF